MPRETTNNPAEIAAQEAQEHVFRCIQSGRSFRLEAGAGAGKTYSLVKAMQKIIDEMGTDLIRRRQKVACITYTNVATDEVIARIDGSSVIHASTIHSFCWELCKNFQATLKQKLPVLEALKEKIEEAGGIGEQRIGYHLGYRRVTDTEIFLHHDDVLKLTVALLELPKFRRILASRYPILFIDEYQDTDSAFAKSLIKYFVDQSNPPLIGLFGDSWQKIYPTGAGTIEHENLQLIGKESNFRSVSTVVNVLNQIRPGLPQRVSDPSANGTATVYHSNSFRGQRETSTHWAGDLPREAAHAYLAALRAQLVQQGWEFSRNKTKILMLTHNGLAAEQEYSEILNVFEYNDSLIKKEDPHIAFLVDTVEPACAAFTSGKYGTMFSILGRKDGQLAGLQDKKDWAEAMQRLIDSRATCSIGEVIDLMKNTQKPRLPEAVIRNENRIAESNQSEIEESRSLRQLEGLRRLPYTQLISITNYINDHTPFSTKHGVKGAQFDNVLVVLGRGWNHYNWNQFLEWFPDRYPTTREKSYIRNRNLFYVCCSRPRTNLALLFTQELTTDALNTLNNWFGRENVSALSPP